MNLGRRRLMKAAGLGAAGAAFALPALAQSAPEVKWRLSSSFPRSLDLLYGAAELFAETVADATDGKFQIQVFPAGDVAPTLQTLDLVQNGTIDACHTAMHYFWGKDPTFAFGTAIPFGMNSRETSAWFYHGDGNAIFNEFLHDFGCYALPAGNTGCQMGGWFRNELKSAGDLEGLKIRIGGFAGKVMQRLGSVPQQTAGGDIYDALQKGTIDAAQWVSPYDDEKMNLTRVAPFYYYPGWWQGASTLHVAFNLDKWNALPKPYQTILTSAAAFVNADVQAAYDARNPAALKRLVAVGSKLRSFPQEVLEASYKATVDLSKEIADANPKFKKVLDSYVGFRNDEYLWWQVGEYTFDNFMIRQRARG
jgi:TRAP-type mannitol/chloroaromatic compound transport system substrate-binding protein